MKGIGIAASFGAALGGVVAVIVHFASRTVPHTFYVGVSQLEGTNRASASIATPLVHPSWVPVLPVSIGVGAVAAVTMFWIARRAGLRLVRDEPMRSDG